MDDNDNVTFANEEDEVAKAVQTGANRIVACLILGLLLCLIGLVGLPVSLSGTPVTPEKTSSAEKSLEIVRLETSKAQAVAQQDLEKRIRDIQMEVIKRCSDRGWVPGFGNGNVACRPAQ